MTEELGTRDKILVAAATMLGEDPTVRLSVRAVASRAGVSVGSLRHFFPDQRTLLDEVLAGIRRIDGTGDPAGDVLADTTVSATERLLTCLRQVLDHVGTGEAARDGWRRTFGVFLDEHPRPDATESFQALEQAGRRRVERWLGILRDEGALLDDDVEGQARYLATVLDGIAVERALPMDAAAALAEDATLRRAVSAVVRPDKGGRGSA